MVIFLHEWSLLIILSQNSILNIVVEIQLCYYLLGGKIMIDIAIVDDDIIFLNMIKNKLLQVNKNLNIVCYQNPYDFMDKAKQIKFLLLDIELPQIDGISLSKQLRENNISIFFITAHKELMIKAFGKNVEGFILKDCIDDGIINFLKFIDKYQEEQSIVVSTDFGKTKIFLDEILYIDYSLRDIEYHLFNNRKVRQKNTNLKDVMQSLNNDFVLINRNTIVNINYTDDIKNEYIIIRNQKFKVSRRKMKNVKIKLLEMRLSDAN